ncbi:MAG: PDZ domain-containing protein [Planctomycetia bacterium]|nr:PDZ domain-containing protein [Planctomycetia bacterium]
MTIRTYSPDSVELRRMKSIGVCAAICLAAAAATAAAGDEVPPPNATAEPLDIDSLVRQSEAVIQVVLANHMDPPTRQEMWLTGTKAMFENVPGLSPVGLSSRISQITKPEEFRAFLRQAWLGELAPEQRQTALPAPRLAAAFLDGLLRPAPQARVLAASEGIAREQLAGNRYVGTGIQLQYDSSEGYAAIGALIRGGPMEKAGGRKGDLITKIGERDTHNLPIEQIIELLRGAEGTVVTLQLRGGADTADPRTITVTRGPVVLDAVEGLTRDRDGNWEFRIEPHLPIGYVKFRQLNGSAVHELRRLERQFRADGVSAVILDFRATSSNDVHQAVLLADALMDGGLIGRLRSPDGRLRELHADRECLFRDWPLAVLIDSTTSGGGEWVAAALQNKGACVIIGESSAGSKTGISIVPVPGENLAVQLPSGVFERPNRKLTQKPASPEPNDGPAEPLPDGVIPDRIVPAGIAPIGVRRPVRALRDQGGGKDIVIAAAVYELRDRIDK